MKFKTQIAIYIAGMAIAAVLLVGINVIVDPFGVFGDPIFDWYDFNMTNNPRAAKIAYLDKHHGEYDSYIIGSSKTGALSVPLLNEYFDGKFYNMLMYGGDLYDVETTAMYIIEAYDPKNIIINIGLEETYKYNLAKTDINSYMHYKLTGENPIIFYSKYAFANLNYAKDKVELYGKRGHLPGYNESFEASSGTYIPTIEDEILVKGSISEYVEQNPGFNETYSMLRMSTIDEVVGGIAKIKAACDERGINFKLIASPVYANEVRIYEKEDLVYYWQRLAEVTDFWDFSGFSPISYDPRYFYNPYHFRLSAGDMALAFIAGDTSVYIPEGFGHYTTRDNVKEHAEKIFTDNPVEINNDKKVPVLMYHHFDENPDNSTSVTITPQLFEEHMEMLGNNGFTAISVRDLIDFVEKGTDLPDKPVVIIMDDGYDSNHVYAYPILEKYGMKGTIAVIGAYMGTTNSDDIPPLSYLNAATGVEMLESGVIDICPHSYDLHDIDIRAGATKTESENEKSYIELFRKDYSEVSACVEQMNGYTDIYVYPYGIWDRLTETLLREMGVKATFTTRHGSNTIVKGLGQSLYTLNRINAGNEEMTAEKLLEELKKYE